MNYQFYLLKLLTIITVLLYKAKADNKALAFIRALNGSNQNNNSDVYSSNCPSESECSVHCAEIGQCRLMQYDHQQNKCYLSGEMNQLDFIKDWQETSENLLQNDWYVKKCVKKKTSGIYKSCAELYKSGYRQSGVYTVIPTASAGPVDVSCDHSNGGGWTVFQSRRDGSVSFNKTWKEYEEGFGEVCSEHWLGNDVLSLMTSHANSSNTLRVDLVAFDGQKAYAEYIDFKVLPDNQNYTLKIGSYTGSAGDSPGLSHHNGMQFSTVDRDNDRWRAHCAPHVRLGGAGAGWWYKHCGRVNLNGPYNPVIAGGGNRLYVVWGNWKGSEQLKETEMKFRPTDF